MARPYLALDAEQIRVHLATVEDPVEKAPLVLRQLEEEREPFPAQLHGLCDPRVDIARIAEQIAGQADGEIAAKSVPDSAFPCFRISGRFSHLPTPLEDADMSQTLVVSSRGQITLPAATRKRLGIKGGDHVILEDRGGEIVLKPGMVLEVQHYSDEQIASWDADDELEERERTRILDAVARQK